MTRHSLGLSHPAARTDRLTGHALTAGAAALLCTALLTLAPAFAATTETLATLQGQIDSVGAHGTVTLTGDVDADGDGQLAIPDSSAVTLDLAGHHLTITDPGAGLAAVKVPSDATLLIEDTGVGGTLTVTGGDGGATSSGGDVTAGDGGSGIGGDGGTVTSLGGSNPNNVRLRAVGDSGKVVIQGGTVTATGGNGADATTSGIALGGFGGAGIGARVVSLGGTLTATGGSGGDASTTASGEHVAEYLAEYAVGGGGGAGIVGMVVSPGGGTLTANGGNGGNATATATKAVALRGGGGAGIEAGIDDQVILYGGTLTATGGNDGAGIDSTVYMTGGSLTATGDGGGVGIDGTLYNHGGSVTVTDGTLDDGTVTKGDGAPPIPSGCSLHRGILTCTRTSTTARAYGPFTTHSSALRTTKFGEATGAQLCTFFNGGTGYVSLTNFAYLTKTMTTSTTTRHGLHGKLLSSASTRQVTLVNTMAPANPDNPPSSLVGGLYGILIC